MATLEALDELYAMGFLIEEEYHARRAALGAPPKEPTSQTDSAVQGTATTSTATDSYSYDPTPTSYESYGTYPGQTTTESPFGGIQDQTTTNVPIYETPISSYETSYSPYVAPIDESTSQYGNGAYGTYGGAEPTDFGTPQTVDPESLIKPNTSAGKEKDISATAAVKKPVATEEPYPTSAVQIDISSLANLKIAPSDDSSHADAFSSIPYGKAAIVNRSAGSYTIHHVDPSESIGLLLSSFGVSNGGLVEVGKWTTETKSEMYWTEVTHVAPGKVSKLEAGKIYMTQPTKTHYGAQYWSGCIDEREIHKHLIGKLERESTFGVATVDIDQFAGDARIADVRTFSGAGVSTSFDPREVIKYMATKLESPPLIGNYSNAPPRPYKVQCSQTTPAFMLWPIFTGLLRGLEVHMPVEHTHVLPTSAVAIWARIQHCIETQSCYITGQPTTYQSFLSQQLHTENIWKVYTEIKEAKEQHGGVVPNRDGSGTLAVSTPSFKGQEAEEMISYDDSAKKRSYGWPARNDTDEKATRYHGPSGRLVSASRQPLIQQTISQLVQLSGPAPMMEA